MDMPSHPWTAQKTEGGTVSCRIRHERATCPRAFVHISIKLWGDTDLGDDDSSTFAQCQLMEELKLTSNEA